MQLRLYNFESFEKSIDDFRLPKEDILAKKKKNSNNSGMYGGKKNEISIQTRTQPQFHSLPQR